MSSSRIEVTTTTTSQVAEEAEIRASSTVSSAATEILVFTSLTPASLVEVKMEPREAPFPIAQLPPPRTSSIGLDCVHSRPGYMSILSGNTAITPRPRIPSTPSDYKPNLPPTPTPSISFSSNLTPRPSTPHSLSDGGYGHSRPHIPPRTRSRPPSPYPGTSHEAPAALSTVGVVEEGKMGWREGMKHPLQFLRRSMKVGGRERRQSVDGVNGEGKKEHAKLRKKSLTGLESLTGTHQRKGSWWNMGRSGSKGASSTNF